MVQPSHNSENQANDIDTEQLNALCSGDVDGLSNDTIVSLSMTLDKMALLVAEELGRGDDDDDKLFQSPPPKRECPICMVPMPWHPAVGNVGATYQSCCGKILCCGCTLATDVEITKGKMKELCVFCRVPPRSNKEILKRLKTRMKTGDAESCEELGDSYFKGKLGLLQNKKKAIELWNEAVDLGSVCAHDHLAHSYHNGDGVARDKEKAIQHWEAAAMKGHEAARHNLGAMEHEKGIKSRAMKPLHMKRAYKHFMIAAKSGFELSLKQVGEGYKDGYVTKDDYATTLRAYQESHDEMKTDERDRAYEARKLGYFS